MKQLRIAGLMWELLKALFRHGNAEVYYHICGNPNSRDCPMEAEGIEARETRTGKKVTIY